MSRFARFPAAGPPAASAAALGYVRPAGNVPFLERCARQLLIALATLGKTADE